MTKKSIIVSQEPISNVKSVLQESESMIPVETNYNVDIKPKSPTTSKLSASNKSQNITKPSISSRTSGPSNFSTSSATSPLNAVITNNTAAGTVVQTNENTFIIETNKEVFVNTYETTTQQQYVSNYESSGYSGFSGYSGKDGAATFSGYSGASGLSGQAFIGSSGASGSSGSSGASGNSGWSGFSSFSGFSGLSGTSGWSGLAFIGSSGISGYSGKDGAASFSGYSGAIGASGTSGASGFSGSSFVGSSGSSGYSGLSGSSSFSGFSGISGTSGINGISGTSGWSGFSGVIGNSGFSGYSGTSGKSGLGFSGYSGKSGWSGLSGVSTSGYSGISGFSGMAGQSGTSGTSGVGISGFSGFSGIAGQSGTSGYSSNITDSTYTVSATSGYPRTVQSKLGDIISVKDFNAIGNGSADDTDAIQYALNAAAGGFLLFPVGTYKVTSTLTISSGTTIEFAGADTKINYYGSGACLQANSVKYVNLRSLNIDLANASTGAIGLELRGAWFVKIDQPNIQGPIPPAAKKSGQIGINIVSSAPSSLGFGAYMIEIFNPSLVTMPYGIKTSQQTSDSVRCTHLSVYDGWGNTCDYPLYYRNLDTFNVFGFTPEGCIDGINLSDSTGGMIHLGELAYSGYAVNFPDATCKGISVLLNSTANGASTINTTFYTPVIYESNQVKLFAYKDYSDYNYSIISQYNLSEALKETTQGGGTLDTLRTYDNSNKQRLYNVKSISSTGTVGSNLRGTATFSAGTTAAVSFGTAEPDSSYYVALSGNAAGYCWVTSKSTSGFTINCSASNSNSVDWILIR